MTMIKFGDNKGEDNPYEALSDPARANLQSLVNSFGNAFEKAVARGRGMKQDDVHSKFGQGRVFDAKTAVRLGMVDRVGTLDDALATTARSTSTSGRQARLSAGAAWLSTSARDRQFARMRHELALLGADVGSPALPPAKPKKRSDVGPDDGCGCDCDPCGNGDCDACDCEDCDCEGCACETAVKAKDRALAFARMRHQLALAGA
jgi:capsid assembly protease